MGVRENLHRKTWFLYTSNIQGFPVSIFASQFDDLYWFMGILWWKKNPSFSWKSRWFPVLRLSHDNPLSFIGGFNFIPKLCLKYRCFNGPSLHDVGGGPKFWKSSWDQIHSAIAKISTDHMGPYVNGFHSYLKTVFSTKNGRNTTSNQFGDDCITEKPCALQSDSWDCAHSNACRIEGAHKTSQNQYWWFKLIWRA